jgi:hypothetical protein
MVCEMHNFNSDINLKNYHGLALELQDEKKLEKFQKQRLERGFDDSEWYTLNNTILSFALPRLKEFKTSSISYPCDMTVKEWDVILDNMISEIEDYISGADGVEPTLFFKYFSQLWS